MAVWQSVLVLYCMQQHPIFHVSVPNTTSTVYNKNRPVLLQMIAMQSNFSSSSMTMTALKLCTINVEIAFCVVLSVTILPNLFKGFVILKIISHVFKVALMVRNTHAKIWRSLINISEYNGNLVGRGLVQMP